MHLGQEVRVTVTGPEGNHLFNSTYDDVKSARAAVEHALSDAVIEVNPEDCVFTVENMATAQIREYRLNAHGHLTEII